MNHISRAGKTLAVTSALGVAAFAAPAAHAADAKAHHDTVRAAAHLDYTVKGMTVTLRPRATGTQHTSISPEDGVVTASGVPSEYELTVPDAAVVDRDELAGQSGLGCLETGSVAFDPGMVSPHPIVVTFPKPGTYEVSLTLNVCTSQVKVHDTVKITVPAPTKPGTPGHPTPPPAHPSKPMPKPGTPGHGAHPTPPPAHPSTPGMGPKVETDKVGDASSSLPLGLSALAGLGAIGGGVAAARRRTQG